MTAIRSRCRRVLSAIMYKFARLFILFIALFFVSRQSAEAALGYVGDMFPRPGSGSPATMDEGNNYDVYIQVYKAGVTEPGGQGADISCTLYWSEVDFFGGPFLNIVETSMSYHSDINNNDNYIATISPPAGLYEHTVYCTDLTDNERYWQADGNAELTVNAVGGGNNDLTDARAFWLEDGVLAWNPGAATVELHHAANGDLTIPSTSGSGIALTANGTLTANDYPKNPNVAGYTRYDLPAGELANVKAILKGEIALVAYDGNGDIVGATRIQIQSVLDDLYAGNASAETLGVSYSGDVPTVRVWAPTAQSLNLLRFADATTAISTTHTMTLDNNSGIWSITGDSSWDEDFYQFEIEVFAPISDTIVTNIVTDPYSVSLSMNSERSQIIDILNDTALMPTGWDSLTKPALGEPEDMAIYELHVRDFSINDATVSAANRGKFGAFTETASNGMQHLLGLQQAGLTHVHLLPSFDIASVNEDPAQRTEPTPSGGRSTQTQQDAVGTNRADDGFNWGYDPFHYGAPEGSYSSDPNGTARILEFREMIQTLNDNGLRVVMDVVYNHTSASGQDDQSVLDKVVPGYYYRYDLDGVGYNSSCCADTATEYAMMEKLMIDTVELWATAYKVDGFRFDLMNLHTVQNAANVYSVLQTIDVDIAMYGEGWDFGSLKEKGGNYASQLNMRGQGIGTFNDRIRDAAHGGYSTDDLQIRKQGFINGLSYQWNGYCYNNRELADLHNTMGSLRTALAGSIADYTDDPQETVNYVSKHDNETLFDQNVFKAPDGVGDTGVCGGGAYTVPSITNAERLRIQNLGLDIVAFAQGIPFFHAGSDMLRSKSLDRNSYDSGDWFNTLDFTYSSNNFAVGLPPAWDNQDRWDIMTPLLDDTTVDPTQAQIEANIAHFEEILQIRQSSKLFRLESAADINQRVSFYNSDNSLPGLVAMGISDAVGADLDGNAETILVVINANITAQEITIDGATNFTLHPVLANSADPIVQTASFNNGTFSVPARTTAVFTSPDAVDPNSGISNIDFVGNMFPVGGESISYTEGQGAPLTIYTQVFEEGVTGNNNSQNQISCFLHWGRYGDPFTDTQMSINPNFNGQGLEANNDEYLVSIMPSSLPKGIYGFTTYCSEDGGTSKEYREGEDGIFVIHDDGAVSADTIVHLFEWKWTDVALECENWLGPKGFAAVQVSPPTEHRVVNSGGDVYPWWQRYQPVSYQLESRSGTEAEFDDMVSRCAAVGVDIYVDAVVNHMAASSGTGNAGSSYDSTTQSYPGVPYTAANFHTQCDITTYQSRSEVQTCRLLGLEDLDQKSADTDAKVTAYLQGLIDKGVKGFRFDGVKHMFAYDFSLVLDELTGSPYVYQEVIEAFGEPVQGFEYFNTGDVTEFDYSKRMGTNFSGNSGCNGSLADMENFGADAAMMPSGHALVFVDNHDNQRGHGTNSDCIVTYRDGVLYDLANIFMLGYDYGDARVMSSYYFDLVNDGQGPPSDGGGNTNDIYSGGNPTGCNMTDWVCEHRNTAIANMVGLRAAAAGQPVTDWWDNGGDWIGFGRSTTAYIAINREAGTNTRTYQTQMPAGDYCNMVVYDAVNGACYEPNTTTPAPTSSYITVNASGEIVNQSLDGMSAFAIHTNSLITAVPTAVGLAAGATSTASQLWIVMLCALFLIGALTFVTSRRS